MVKVELGPRASVVTEGGARISWREAGAGFPVLLLHGIGSNSGTWLHQLRFLSHRHRVIAWDMPGYGLSDCLSDEWPGAADYAASLRAFVDALELKSFHLVGHSFGALIAASYCSQHPQRVGRLVLASPASGHALLAEELRNARLQQRLSDMQQHGPQKLAELSAANSLSPQASAEAVELIRVVMTELRPDGYTQAARMLSRADIFRDLPGINATTLVNCGSLDKVTPEEGCRAVAAAIAGSTYATLVGVGHASYVENPGQFNAVLEGFLD